MTPISTKIITTMTENMKIKSQYMQAKIEWLTRTTPTVLPSTNSSEDNRPP
jgi:hypothetical protein